MVGWFVKPALRLLAPQVLSAEECVLLVAGGLVAMASAELGADEPHLHAQSAEIRDDDLGAAQSDVGECEATA